MAIFGQIYRVVFHMYSNMENGRKCTDLGACVKHLRSDLDCHVITFAIHDVIARIIQHSSR